MKLVVGIAGASGSIYAASFLKTIMQMKGETYLIVSPASIRIFSEEFDTVVRSPQEIIDFIANKWRLTSILNNIQVRDFTDIGSDIASGSNIWNSMVIIPTSMKTLAAINAGITENLIERCADVTLKEKRKLILVPRETPYNRIHLKNMLSLDEAGALILPASPAFYQKPKTIDDLADFISGRILNLLGVENSLFQKWEG